MSFYLWCDPPPRTNVYLMRRLYFGQYAALPMAELQLTDSTVRCILTGTSGYAAWLAERLRIPDLKERLAAGQQVPVFEYPRNGYEIKWPTLGVGTAFQISRGEAPWNVSFVTPGGPGAAYQGDGQNRKQWRSALDPSQSANRNQVSYAAPAPAQQQTTPPLPPPGWYPDPAGASGRQRYWDGRQWTSATNQVHH
jgi:uncharacterized protein DUF2510